MNSHDILNDAGLLKIRDGWFHRLSQLFDGVHGEQVFILSGVGCGGERDMYAAPEKWMAEALDDLASKAESLRDTAVFRPLCVNPWPYGVHFVDTLFGARTYELDGEKNNWQAEYLRIPVGQLEDPGIEAHPSFKLAQRLAAAFVEVGVSVPVFAPPVLSSPLNIALNLFGQEFLVAMLNEPDKARSDLRVITDTIKRLHVWFQRNIPFHQLQMIAATGRSQPPGHGQICGCSAQLISAGQYDEFIAPLDQEILALYPGGGLIHLCGSYAQHIPTWKAMAALRAVQLNDRAAADAALFFAGLRPDQILYVNPCAAMPVSGIMEITGGRRTVIVADIKEPLQVR